MQLNDLLGLHGIDPRKTNVMLRSPRHREAARALPTLVHTRRPALEWSQSTHSGPATRALQQRRPHVAVVVRVDCGVIPARGLIA